MTFAALMGGDIQHVVEEDLARVKEVAERSAQPGTPSGDASPDSTGQASAL